ncbi:hypothetical protein [Bradyrhizobium sp. BR 10289]|uniref:helix-turn-helix transcriptional regulator n=1 Tax=Bradyrhizobium sp. BR 10289 TaxID=2749993 RepID=UPI001C64AD24|nr:hypothetical protein [Bradyrhizobium sp. BR 10289]MBW7968617.1 AlpA family phage regulatory protein [Bradyrhizobium sp. BR 10289]
MQTLQVDPPPSAAPIFSPSKLYLSAAQVRQRYGNISDMTLWRWLKNNSFPAPRKINGRRYWDAADLDAWDAGRAG